MAEAQPSPGNAPQRLEELARRLRSARHLDAEAQHELADLVEELAKALATATTPTPESAHLAESAAHVAQALHQRHEAGLLESARRRLEESAIRAEAEAPLAVGIVRRLLAALADLGI